MGPVAAATPAQVQAIFDLLYALGLPPTRAAWVAIQPGRITAELLDPEAPAGRTSKVWTYGPPRPAP